MADPLTNMVHGLGPKGSPGAPNLPIRLHSSSTNPKLITVASPTLVAAGSLGYPEVRRQPHLSIWLHAWVDVKIFLAELALDGKIFLGLYGFLFLYIYYLLMFLLALLDNFI